MAEEKHGHYERRGDVDEWVWDDEPEPAKKPEPKAAPQKAAPKAKATTTKAK